MLRWPVSSGNSHLESRGTTVFFFETNLSLVTHHVAVCLYVSHLVSHKSKPAVSHLASHSVSYPVGKRSRLVGWLAVLSACLGLLVWSSRLDYIIWSPSCNIRFKSFSECRMLVLVSSFPCLNIVTSLHFSLIDTGFQWTSELSLRSYCWFIKYFIN